MEAAEDASSSFHVALLFVAAGGLGLSFYMYIAFAMAQEEKLGPVGAVFIVAAAFLGGLALQLAGSFILVGLMFFLAGRLGGRGGFRGYYGALGLASPILWSPVLVVPSFFLGLPSLSWALKWLSEIVMLWYLVVAVFVTSRVLGITVPRAAMAVLAPITALALFAMLAAR